MNRRGFTIVEMLMVIGVLGILVTLVTVASTTVIRKSRVRRTDAMKYVLKAGFATYYTHRGEWPGKLKTLCDDGPTSDFEKNKGYTYLDDTFADQAIRKLVDESRSGNPMLDISGLFVAKSDSASKKNTAGMDFRQAVLKNSRGGKMAVAQMAFGYPESEKGHFRRFVIKYNFKTDTVDVMTQSDFATDEGSQWSGRGPTSEK